MMQTEPNESLRYHDGGAVMILGLFLALGAVAGMWCLIGIGDAVLARDVAQEATDSAAFTNAVVHARGMNAISFINMVLMAFVMVYLTLSWLDMLVSAVLLLIGVNNGVNNCYIRYLSYALDITIPWCNIARGLEKISSGLLKGDRAVFDRFEKLAPPLFETQVWIAQLSPYLGTAAAAEIGSEYKHLVVSMSLSNFPGGGALRPLNKAFLLDKIPLFNSSPGSKPGVDPAKAQGDANLFQDRRIGLPMEAEPAYFMCVRGARFPLEYAKDHLTSNFSIGGQSARKLFSEEPLTTIMYGFFQSVGEYNRALFCNEKDAKIGEALKFLKDPQFISSMWQIRGGYESRKKALRSTISLILPNNTGLRWIFYLGLHKFSGPKINEKFYLESRPIWRQNWPKPEERTSPNDDDGYFAGPKRVPAYAYNGNDWMQVWAITPTSFEPNPLADKIVGLPSRLFGAGPGDKDVAAAASGGTHVFLTQAEFFFDCASVWQSSQCNKGSAASYQLKWKARLRRIHHPNYLADVLELYLDNALAGTVFKRFSKSKLDAFAKMLESKAGIYWPGSQILREGVIKAVRNDITKYGNGQLSSDTSSDGYLH